MAKKQSRVIKFIPYLSYLLLGFILLLNIAWANIEAPPRLPDFQALKNTFVFSLYSSSALIQGIAVPDSFLLLGIFLLVILPWTILALVFKRNILRIILSITAYTLILAGISWLLSRFEILPALPPEEDVFRNIMTLCNIPFGYIFYVAFLLVGHSLYPFPLFLVVGASMLRYPRGNKGGRPFKILLWGYLELILLIMLIGFYSPALSGGVLFRALGDYSQVLIGRAGMTAVVMVTFFFYALFLLGKKPGDLIKGLGKKGKEKKDDPKKEKTGKQTVKLDLSCLPDEYITAPSILRHPVASADTPVPDGESESSARKVLESLFQLLDLPLTYDSTEPGPRFLLILYRLGDKGSLKQVKSQSEELRFRLQEEAIEPIIPLPGRSLIGFLKERTYPDRVNFEQVEMDFYSREEKLPLYLGKELNGSHLFTDLSSHPHLLVGGSSGSGKSVFLHVLIQSLIHNAQARNIRLILMDPKGVEFSSYKKSPHLACPVLQESGAMEEVFSSLIEEMEKRYEELNRANCRDIVSYNQKSGNTMSYTVVIIDEASDILLQDDGSIKKNIILLAQKSRAAGIHLVLATQRPSSDVIDGLIKANFPARLAFRTASAVDSRIILDEKGAENLKGTGDGLFLFNGSVKRFQAAFWDSKKK